MIELTFFVSNKVIVLTKNSKLQFLVYDLELLITFLYNNSVEIFCSDDNNKKTRHHGWIRF